MVVNYQELDREWATRALEQRKGEIKAVLSRKLDEQELAELSKDTSREAIAKAKLRRKIIDYCERWLARHALRQYQRLRNQTELSTETESSTEIQMHDSDDEDTILSEGSQYESGDEIDVEIEVAESESDSEKEPKDDTPRGTWGSFIGSSDNKPQDLSFIVQAISRRSRHKSYYESQSLVSEIGSRMSLTPMVENLLNEYDLGLKHRSKWETMPHTDPLVDEDASQEPICVGALAMRDTSEDTCEPGTMPLFCQVDSVEMPESSLKIPALPTRDRTCRSCLRWPRR